MTLLILGIVLWILSHTLKRIAPGLRASMGEEKGKGPVALMALAGIVLMVIGYRGLETAQIYMPVPGMGHLNNTLMLVSLFFFGAGSVKGLVASKVRHNMLTGLLIWSLAHLTVNGDLASIVLFGSMAVYSVLSMWLISRAVPWERPMPGPVTNDLKAVAAAVVLFAIITAIHWWLGYSPFLGTYQ